jgi:hypothetical protein
MIFGHKILISVVIASAIFMPADIASAASGGPVIYQLQTGSVASASQEYISLFNNAPQPVDISNWCVVYSSASGATQTTLSCFTVSAGSRLYLPSESALSLASNEFIQANTSYEPDFIFTSGISATGGHIKLLDESKQVVDLVGWGTATAPETKAVTSPSTGKVLQRMGTPQLLKDTENNFSDFTNVTLAMVETGKIYEEIVQTDVCLNLEGTQTELPADHKIDETGNCIVSIDEAPILSITEVYPDAPGADAGQEFIELYNPHDFAVSLKGYTLKLSTSDKMYSIPDISIPPLGYAALTDTETGITLPNTSTSVLLHSPSGTVLSQSGPYDKPGEGKSWALIDEKWVITNQPTPGSINNVVTEKNCEDGYVWNESSSDCILAVVIPASVCPPGQERNAQTNRCRKIAVLSEIICKTGYEKNPETGRCRSLATASKKVISCKVNQERNPATGRCRNIVTASTAQCPTGQERNAETNRCRKVASATNGSMPQVKDVQAAMVTNSVKWWFAGSAALGSVSYGVYEWRREVWGIAEILKAKLRI